MIRIKRLFHIIVVLVIIVSCKSGIFSNGDLKKQQFNRGKMYNHYELCVFLIYKTEWKDDNIGYQNDTMLCCCPIGTLYERMNVFIEDECTFIDRAYNMLKSGGSIQVSPELYSDLYSYKVSVDAEINSIYKRDGIFGIISLLATRSIRDWEKNEYERFKYIVYLCWQNDLFFYDYTQDEVLAFKWYVTGNKSLTKRYYSLSDKDVWFYP